MVKLTKNFTIEEMVYSPTAEANKIDNRANVVVIENLKCLCENVLQPLRDYLGCAVKVTSGYRSEALNRKIGGVKNSQHKTGKAADIIVPNKKLNDVFEYIKANLPFDQLLLEHNAYGRWIHVSYDKNKNRKYAVKDYSGS